MRKFKDRSDAGKHLGVLLSAYQDMTETLVIGVVRGGMVVAHEAAKHLRLPLDFAIVRKIGCPENRELGAGAMTSTGAVFFKESFMEKRQLTPSDFTEVIEEELDELKRRSDTFGVVKANQSVMGKTVLIIDDGIAMGVTLKAVVKGIKKEAPKKIILAVPVASPVGISYLKPDVDEIITSLPPESFERRVDDAYESFADTTDEEVITILKEHIT